MADSDVQSWVAEADHSLVPVISVENEKGDGAKQIKPEPMDGDDEVSRGDDEVSRDPDSVSVKEEPMEGDEDEASASTAQPVKGKRGAAKSAAPKTPKASKADTPKTPRATKKAAEKTPAAKSEAKTPTEKTAGNAVDKAGPKKTKRTGPRVGDGLEGEEDKYSTIDLKRLKLPGEPSDDEGKKKKTAGKKSKTDGKKKSVTNGKKAKEVDGIKQEPGVDDEATDEEDDEDLSPAPSSVQAPLCKQLSLLSSVNICDGPDLRTLFMGQASPESEELWVNLIAKKTGDDKKMRYQCYFCPEAADMPKAISDHLELKHEELGFAINRSKRVGGNVTYFFCRHCNFVASECVIAWIHFEAYHKIGGILDSGGNAIVKPDIDDDFTPLPLENFVHSPLAYACLDCNSVTDNRRRLAHHIVRDHGIDTEHFNGFFVKALQLQKPLGEVLIPGAKPKFVTYKQLMEDLEQAGQRKECYVCFTCSFVAYGAYLAISHYITTHQQLRLVQVCMQKVSGGSSLCLRQYQSEKNYIDHIRCDHRDLGVHPRTQCSVTLIQTDPTKPPVVGEMEFVECTMQNRAEPTEESGSPKKVSNGQSVSGGD